MGRRGPVPKSNAEKSATGNPGKRRLVDDEPLPPPGEIVAPDWLGPEARKIWDRQAPIGIAMRTLTTADIGAFARYCECFARYVELNRFLMKKGPAGTTYKLTDEKGKLRCIVEIPQAIEYRRLHELLIKLEESFGLTPGSRSRLRVTPNELAPVAAAASLTQADKERQDFFARGGPATPRVPPKRASNAT